jgi:hypothetical protein
MKVMPFYILIKGAVTIITILVQWLQIKVFFVHLSWQV